MFNVPWWWWWIIELTTKENYTLAIWAGTSASIFLSDFRHRRYVLCRVQSGILLITLWRVTPLFSLAMRSCKLGGGSPSPSHPLNRKGRGSVGIRRKTYLILVTFLDKKAKGGLCRLMSAERNVKVMSSTRLKSARDLYCSVPALKYTLSEHTVK